MSCAAEDVSKTDDAGGFAVEDVISRVKQAIQKANLSAPTADMVVTKVDLQLAVETRREGGVDATFKVPVINKTLGAKASDERSATNTICITLVPPPPPAGKAFGLVAGVEDIGSELERAIVVIRQAVSSGAREDGTEVAFGLEQASVELAFGLSRDGSISLVATGEIEMSSTNTVKLTLAPRKPAGAAGKASGQGDDKGVASGGA